MYIQKCKNSILKSKSHFPTWTSQLRQIRMGDNTNLFTLSESVINAIKKPELVQKIIALKGKVIVDSDISNLCNQISKLNDTISQLHSTNEKITSDLLVVKNVNAKLEEQIISLEKSQAKSEQYSRRNNIELSGIPNDIPEDNLEKVVIDICGTTAVKVTERSSARKIFHECDLLDLDTDDV